MEMIELKNISKRFSVEKRSFYVLKDVLFLPYPIKVLL